MVPSLGPCYWNFLSAGCLILKTGNSTELLNTVSVVIGKLQGKVQKTQPFPGQVDDACLGGNSAACPR